MRIDLGFVSASRRLCGKLSLMASTNPARGMRDFLPADVRKREYVIGVIKQVYESYGFEPLETPAVENLETLMGKYGEEGNQLIFPILKRGDKLSDALDPENPQSAIRDPRSLADLALRYDLTVPLARVVANNKNDLPKFFKRYQIQPVWRADRPARGRFREFYQCDVDAIGSDSMVVETEIISAACRILQLLGFNDFVIRVNHRELLATILMQCGIEERNHVDALIAIDKLEKIGSDGVKTELIEKGILQTSVNSLLTLFDDLINIATEYDAVNKFMNFALLAMAERNFKSDISDADIGLSHLKTLLHLIPDGTVESHVKVDPSLARGLSYYTGTIMEIVLTDGDFKGSIGGGGRYDGLIGMFGKEQIPACGFSLGLERILVVMEERGMFPPEIAESTPADVMVTIWSEETIADSLKLANELRSQGLRVTLYPQPDKFAKQMKYADQIKVPYVAVLGESEIAEGKVTIKNMRTGEQNTFNGEEVARRIK